MKYLKASDFIPIAVGAIFILLLIGEGRFERWEQKRKSDRELLKTIDRMMRPENKLYITKEGDHWIATNKNGVRLRIDAQSDWDGQSPFIAEMKEQTNGSR